MDEIISFNPSTKLIRRKKQIFSEIDSEIVMLSVENEMYYNLNEIASEIWNLLEVPHQFADLIKVLTEKYDVSDKRCMDEITPFLADLIRDGLVKILDEN